MAKEKNYLFKEISAKDGTNVNDLFYIDIFDKISKNYGLVENNEDSTKQAVKDMKEGGGKIVLVDGGKDSNVKNKKKPFIKKFC